MLPYKNENEDLPQTGSSHSNLKFSSIQEMYSKRSNIYARKSNQNPNSLSTPVQQNVSSNTFNLQTHSPSTSYIQYLDTYPQQQNYSGLHTDTPSRKITSPDSHIASADIKPSSAHTAWNSNVTDSLSHYRPLKINNKSHTTSYSCNLGNEYSQEFSNSNTDFQNVQDIHNLTEKYINTPAGNSNKITKDGPDISAYELSYTPKNTNPVSKSYAMCSNTKEVQNDFNINSNINGDSSPSCFNYLEYSNNQQNSYRDQKFSSPRIKRNNNMEQITDHENSQSRPYAKKNPIGNWNYNTESQTMTPKLKQRVVTRYKNTHNSNQSKTYPIATSKEAFQLYTDDYNNNNNNNNYYGENEKNLERIRHCSNSPIIPNSETHRYSHYPKSEEVDNNSKARSLKHKRDDPTYNYHYVNDSVLQDSCRLYEIQLELYFGYLGVQTVFVFISFIFANYAGGVLHLYGLLSALYSHVDRRTASYALTAALYTVIAIVLIISVTVGIQGFMSYQIEPTLKAICIGNIPLHLLFIAHNISLAYQHNIHNKNVENDKHLHPRIVHN